MPALEAHPHAAAVLGAALPRPPIHAYLFHGPAGAGKREAAREFAAELLARDARRPDENARARAARRAPRPHLGRAQRRAHDAARRRRRVGGGGRRRTRRSRRAYRVFVLERVDTMNDPAANTLLKTLEEPPAYVVLILLTDRPGRCCRPSPRAARACASTRRR